MAHAPALLAGAAAADITNQDSQFLYGYPHVKRFSTGVHDKLWASALYVSDGGAAAIFVANDVILISKESALRVRERIARSTGVPAAHVMVTVTHTHSGPITMDYISCEADPIIPPTDAKYVRLMEDGIVSAAEQAVRDAGPAEAGLAFADSTGIGTNRRDPKGPSDHQVPVLIVRDAGTHKILAGMVVVSMHPTVLHEDSTLVSGDFPGLARLYLQRTVLGADAPLLWHSGPAGNQSPRHVTKGNTFAEAQRLGEVAGRAIEKAITGGGVTYRRDLPVACQGKNVELLRRRFPSVTDAEGKLRRSLERLESLRRGGAAKPDVRTAECDWFGAEETLTLAKAASDGRLEAKARWVMPAEVQVIRVGPWSFVGWPGEMFIEYGLAVKKQRPGTFVISLANGELQGYIVTPEAAAEGGYEASNAVFAPESGGLLVEAALELTK